MKRDFDLDKLEDFFQKESVVELKEILGKLHGMSGNRAERILLLQRYLAVIEGEKQHNAVPVSTSPSGMAFIYCDYERARYILLSLNGMVELFQNWLICEGELDVCDVLWMEKDHLVVFDVAYIVHGEVETCVCHFTNDDNGFVFFSKTRKKNIWEYQYGKPDLYGDTLWICSKCGAGNPMSLRCCTNCGEPRSW